jgi:hypothetical protein
VPGLSGLVGGIVCCGPVKGWLPLRHVWPTLARAEQLSVEAKGVVNRKEGEVIRAESRKRRRGRSRAGEGRYSMLGIDAVGALTALGLEGFDGVSGLLHRASHKPANL